jgi:hypothetical protein
MQSLIKSLFLCIGLLSITQLSVAQTANNAYGDNQVVIDTTASGAPIFAIYSGDMNQDGSIDIFDFPIYDSDNLNFATGYLVTDINGDGSVDIFDFPIYDANNLAFVGVIRP